MVRKQKKGAYEHLSVLIFGQGQWSETDRQLVVQSIRNETKKYLQDPYPFFMKLTRRSEPFNPGSCDICTPAYDLIQELKGQADGIIYLGHHYLIPEDDLEDMVNFIKLVLENNKVKKMYLLYLDGFGEIKRTQLATWDLETLKAHIQARTLTKDDFLKDITSGKFDNRVLYEIVNW
ncbi:MAG: hypothetical protein ACXAAO_05445 [Candidatus Thorarchaeota archaeon]